MDLKLGDRLADERSEWQVIERPHPVELALVGGGRSLNQNADAVLARRGSSTAEGLVFGGRWERYQTAWERARARARLADVRRSSLA